MCNLSFLYQTEYSPSTPCTLAWKPFWGNLGPFPWFSEISDSCQGPVCFPCLGFLSQSLRAVLAPGQVFSKPYWCQVEAVASQKPKSFVRWHLTFLYLSWCCRGLLSIEWKGFLAQTLCTLSFELSQRPLKGGGVLCKGPCTTFWENVNCLHWCMGKHRSILMLLL